MSKKDISKEIADLQEAINSPATPEAQKQGMKKILERLKSQQEKSSAPNSSKKATTPKSDVKNTKYIDYERLVIDKIADLAGVTNSDAQGMSMINEKLIISSYENGKSPEGVAKEILGISDSKKPAKKAKNTKPAKKSTKTASQPKSKAGKSEFKPHDCDELLKKEKQAHENRVAAAKERASQPTKTEATKNKETIEKAAERVETNISKRIEKGEVSKAEIQKLITETEDLLKKLKSALKKAK